MFAGWLLRQEAVLHVADLALSFAVITLLPAIIFKLLPDAKIEWRDVCIGAGLTSALFTIGKFLNCVVSRQGPCRVCIWRADSLVIVLVWVYYSSQILLFGPKFTSVYANRYGCRIVPGDRDCSGPRCLNM